jgi:hypothetical protein
MISQNELVLIKERLLISAEAARHLVGSDNPVRYEESEYWRVRFALQSLEGDVAAVLAELDTLRGMFVERVNEFFQTEGFTNAIGSGSRDGQDAGASVGGVPDGADVGSGQSPQPDNAEPSSPAPAKRAYRRRKPRSKPVGDTAGVPEIPAGVDPGASAPEVGGPAPDQ